QPVNAAGQPAFAAGQPAVAAGQPAGAAGQPVNAAAGQPVSATGQPVINAAGQPVNAAGQPVINAAGQPATAAAGQPVINAAGQPVINAAGQPVINAAGQPATAAAGQTVGATGIPATSASGQTGSPVTANGLPIATSTGATVSATGHPVSATGQTTNPSGQPVSSTTGQAASSTGEPTPPSSGQATNSAGQPVASNTAQSTNSGGQPISSTTGQPGNSNTTDHAPTTSPPLSTSVQPAATSSELKEELELLGWTAMPDVTPTVAPHIEATTTATEVHSSKPDAWWTPLPILDEQGQSENNPPSTSAPSNAPASREPDLNDHRTVPAATENTEHRAVPDQPNSRRLTELPDGRTSVWDIPDHSTSPHTNSSAVSTNNERSEWEADPNEWSTPATANNNNVIVGTNSGVVTDPQSPNTNVPLTNEPQWSDVVLGTGIGNIFAGGLGSLVDGLAGPSTTNTSNTTNNNDHRTVPESTVNDHRTVPEPTVNDHRTVQDLPDNRIITELPGGRTSVWDIPDRSHETAPTGNSSNNSSISASGTRPNWEAAPDEWAPPAPTVTDHRTAPQSNNNDRTVPETVNDHRTVPETTVNDHRTVPDLPDNRTITELPGGRTSVWDIPDRSNETPTGSNTTNHLAPGTKPEWEADPDEWAPPPPTPVHNPNQGDGTQGNGPKDGIGWGNLPPIGNVPDPQPHSGWPTGSPPVVGQWPDSGGTVHNEPAAPSSPSTSPPAPPQSSASTHPDTPPAANNSSVPPVADGTASSSGAPQETTTYPYNGAGPTPGPIDFTPGRPDGIFDASPGRADQIAAEMALLELLNAMANNANANDANKGAKSGEPPVGPATPNTPPSNRVETIDQISGAGRLPPGDNTRQPELTDAPAADHKLHLPEKLAPLEQILNQLPGIDKIADLLNLQEQTHKPDQDLPVVNPLAIVNEIMAPIIDPERSDRTHGTAQNPLAESANLNALGDKIEEIIAGGIHNSTHSHQDATLLSVDQLVEALRHNDGGSAIDPQQLINNVIDNTFTSPQGLDITSGMIDELSLPEAISNMGGRIGPHILNQSTDPDNVIPQIEYDLDSAMANALLDAEQHQTDIASAIDEIIYGEQPPVDLYDNMLDGKLEEPLAEAFLEEQIEKEKRRIKELREKEDEERKEREERLREEEAKRYAAAMLAALKARQAQEQANRIRRQQEQEAAKAEIRQRYIVMPGDTLESIAQKRLYNKRLAPLIFELNRGKIPVKIQDGKKLLQLRAKTVLLLPSTADVKRFHSRVFGRSTEKFEYDPDCVEEAKTNTGSASGFPFLSDDTVAAPFVPRSFTGRKTDANGNVTGKSNTDPQGVPLPSATKKRRDNVEAMLGKVQETSPGDEGRIKYICRLGDSLRSIAINHPALRDVSLWRLVAEINGLSSETNGKGVPVAELKRGEKILLPLPSEIVAHRQLKRAESSTKNTLGQIVSKPCTHCHRLAVQTATICPGCGTTFESSGSDSLPHEHYGPVRQQSVAHQYGLNTTDIAETVDPPLIDLSSDEAAIERALKAMPSRSQLLDVADTVATGEFSPLSPNRPPGKIPVPSERHTAIHPVDAGMRSEDRHSTGERTGARNVITQISDECRVVTYGNFDDSAVGFRTRLEFKQREFWLPVTMYEINADTTWRHEYNPGGSRKTSRIYLPAVQAKQLAINDLEKNWESYVRPFRKPE
ncbi:MAG: hypothetical protein K2W95_34985, partial [Candidatus Obscuribacterales bacterium]|nr:hypothetical protein [Candidatus Obscuribacterales bacterium]